MSIKAIFIDFYGTVVHEDGEIISKICSRIKESSTMEVSKSEIGRYWWDEFYNLFTESFSSKFKTQRELESISLKNTLAHFDSSENESELSELMFNHWMKPAIFDDSVEFFKNNNLPIYILSNIDRFDILEAINLHNLKVTEVITSEDVKSYKPRSDMFEYALKRSNLTFDEVLHVGDSLSSDIAGAKKIGIKSVWVNRTRKKFSGNVKPDFTFDNLNDILKITDLNT
jgi:2-haloalkanoic acid dehalogenase type II